jgi:DNA-binding HxlR family transcriptional regulator
VSNRRYAQFCSIARALDTVGDRWSLLVVRELLDGPRRYTDLQDGLPGIATDMLAARLRDLEAAGVVGRRTLPPPAASKVYELTELGRGLEPVMIELTRWGVGLLGARQAVDAFEVRWLAHPLRAMFRPDTVADERLAVHFRVDGQLLTATVEHGALAMAEGEIGDPDVVITATAETLAEAWADPNLAATLIADGRLVVTGTAAAMRRFGAAFRFDVRPARRHKPA